MSGKRTATGVRQRHTRACTRPASGCRCRWEWHFEGRLDPVAGRREQASHGGYATMREAKAARAAYIADLPNRAAGRRRTTVGEWLVEWLAAKTDGAGKRIKASTGASYADHVHRLLMPRLGRRLLVELTAEDIEKAFTSIKADHPRMSDASRGRVFATLRASLNVAVKHGLIGSNPCQRTSLSSSIPAPKVRPWTTDELTAFLSHADVQADRLFPVLLLLSMTGLRRGEACGLRWSDIDLTDGFVRPKRSRTVVDHRVVEGTAKTAAGEERLVGLDDLTVEVLDEWRVRQQRETWDWPEEHRGADDPYVFTELGGQPVDPEKVTRTFYALTRRAGIRHVRLHDLRHGTASGMLKSGTPLLVVSKVLGHSNIAVTANIYSHLDPSQNQEAVRSHAALVAWTRSTEQGA